MDKERDFNRENPYDIESEIFDNLNSFRKFDEHYDFMVNEFIKKTGRSPYRILDIGCGTGNNLMVFARKGCECTGIDLSDGMLSIAKGKRDEEGLKIDFYNEDILTFNTDKKFDLIYSIYGVSNLFEKSKMKKLFEWIETHLIDDGVLIVDFYTTASLSSTPSSWLGVKKEDNEIIRLQFNKNDTRNKISTTMRTYLEIRGDQIIRRVEQKVIFQLYTVNSFMRMIEKCGFKDVNMYDANIRSYTTKRPLKSTYLAVAIAQRGN